MTTSDDAVTRDNAFAASHPSSFAKSAAICERASKTALIGKLQSLSRRAMFAPIRPTPTTPILSVIALFFLVEVNSFANREKTGCALFPRPGWSAGRGRDTGQSRSAARGLLCDCRSEEHTSE